LGVELSFELSLELQDNERSTSKVILAKNLIVFIVKNINNVGRESTTINCFLK